METTTSATEPPITSQQAPDFGEPWQDGDTSGSILGAGFHNILTENDFDRHSFLEWASLNYHLRAIQSVNACAGMADPAKEIQAMRDAIKAAFAALDSDALWAFDNNPPKELEARWHDGKGSLTSGPNNCLAFFERRKSALAKLQPHLPAKL